MQKKLAAKVFFAGEKIKKWVFGGHLKKSLTAFGGCFFWRDGKIFDWGGSIEVLDRGGDFVPNRGGGGYG